MPGEREPLLATHGVNGDSNSYGSSHSHGQQQRGSSVWSQIKTSLGESVDPTGCGAALTWQCVIAGAADAAAFSQTSTWVGFMTGNLTQLTISAVTLILTHPSPPTSVSRLTLSTSSMAGFVLGSLVASFVDARYHGKHRGKLALAAIIRAAVFASIVPYIAWYGWTGQGGMLILFLMAANMGSMAVCATKLGPTPYSTTVVFTATLASLFSDPMLPFHLSHASQTRAISIAALIAGGSASQATMILSSRLLDGSTRLGYGLEALKEAHPAGSALAVGLVAVFEVFCALSWLRAKSSSS